MKKNLQFTLILAVMLITVVNISAQTTLNVPDQYATIQVAIDAASSGDIIEVADGTYDITSQIDVNKDVSIIGQGTVIINANNSSWSTVNGEKHLLCIYAGTQASPVTISNITMDCNSQCYGLNTYDNAYGILDDVIINDGTGAGLTVNGSTIIATDLNTSGNSWGAVNVDPGSGVTDPTVFTLNSGTLAEDNQIWSDGANVTSTATVTVNAVGYDEYINGSGKLWTNRQLTNCATITNSGETSIYFTIQSAIDAATTGDVINVAAGTYTEAIVINKPLTLRGATYNVNKNGYAVPANYAWDPTVESIIQHPDAASGYTAIVDIEDVSNVTFEGFVVQELNAVANLNSSLVRTYAHTEAISNIVIRNNIIGPNTNTSSQDGAQGRMGLYIVNNPYSGDYGVTNSIFSGNKIFDCQGNGNNIFIWSSYFAYGATGPASMAGTVIDDNEISGAHRSGLESAGGYSNLTISNNNIFGNSSTVDGCTYDAKLKYGHGILLIRGAGDKQGNSSQAYGPTDLTIVDNHIYNNEKSGIYMGPMNTNYTITGNEIHDNGINGILLDLEARHWNGTFEPAPVPVDKYAVYDGSSNLNASNNSIYSNGDGDDFGIEINGTPTNGFIFQANCNWWGTIVGSEIDALIDGTVDYSTILLTPILDPADPGYDCGTAWPKPVHNIDLNLYYATIQEGIDAASDGNTIEIALGTYSENININKRLTIIGAGSDSDPSYNTIITQNTTGSGDAHLGVVQLNASGNSAAEPIILQDIRIEPVGMGGIHVGRFTEGTAVSVAFLKFDNVHVVGTNLNPSTEQERGFYIDLTSTADNIVFEDCAFDNLTYGWYAQKEVSEDASTFSNITVTNTTFNHNNHKGIYTEKLTNATFTTCTANNNGFDSSVLPSYFQAWSAGVDVNLKAGTYANLAFDNCTFQNNATDQAKEGVGLTVKARDDGTTYGAYPASVDVVTLENCTITGNERGVRFGEPEKNNLTPTNVTITNNAIHDNIQHYSESDGSAYGDLINATISTNSVDANCNWWGTIVGSELEALIIGNVDYSSILLTPIIDPADPGYNCGTAWPNPVHNIDLDTYYATIQDGVDEALDGHTIEVAPGTYVEHVQIDVPNLTLQSSAGFEVTIINAPSVGLETPGISVVKNMGIVTVNGFTTNNFRNGIVQGMSQSEGTTFIVKNSKVIPENINTNPYLRNGIQVSGNGSQIIGNYIVGAPLTSDWASTGLHVVNASNVLVKDNIVNTNPTSGAGIGITNWNSPIVENITIEGNSITAEVGIKIAGPSSTTNNVKDVYVYDNLLNDNTSAGIIVQNISLENLTATGNQINDNYMGLLFSSSATISGDILLNENSIVNTYNVVNSSAYSGINANCNWWGTTDPTLIAQTLWYTPVIWSPFLLSNDLENPECGGYAPLTNLNTGLSYLTIQEAIDAASPGDEIKILAGTYDESIDTRTKGGLIFSPGSSPGCVTITGNLTLTSADVFTMEIDGPTACSEYDKFIVDGTLDWNNATVNIILGSYAPLAGTTFTLFESTTLTNFTPTIVYSCADGYTLAVDPENPNNILLTTNNNIDIAIHEVGCGYFEVVLRPNFTPADAGITNVQFTVKYPIGVTFASTTPSFGFVVGETLPDTENYKFMTWLGFNLPNSGWVAGEEYVVLEFEHNRNVISPVTDDFIIVPEAEATNKTQYYAEYWGSDISGNIYANVINAVLSGCPVWNETQNHWYYKIQAAIDEANTESTDVIRAYNVAPNNGIFAEDILVDRSVSLYGPNDGISPNTGTRDPNEVVIHPATSSPSGEIIKVQASDVTVAGFTIDGDNPNLTSGILGTNGADLDAAEAVTVYVDNVNNLTVQNNIIKNLTFFGVTINGAYYGAPSTSGHLVDNNLFQNLGHYDNEISYSFWGGGVLIYNDQYTRITNNVMTNVRLGIQTGNFHKLNPGLTDYQVIDNNIIQARRRGIFYNLHTGANVSSYTLSNNTITGLSNENETVWDGILMASLSNISGIANNNNINGIGITVPSEGYEIWNVKNDAPALISGGSVSNVDIGVFANNYEGYTSSGSNGAHGTISGMTINPNAGGTGIYLKDSPDYTGAATTIELEINNNVISGGAEGIKLEETIDGSVTAIANNNKIISNSGLGVNSSVLNQMNASCNWWGSANINDVAAEVSDDVIYLPFLITDDENAPSSYPDGFDPLGPCASPISMKVWLQGPYDATNDEMNTNINAKLPTTQPFNPDPWNYAGTETLPSPLPSDIVDWVLVELRTGTAAKTSVKKAAGLLYNDGSVVANFVDADQSTPYYVVVYQRNHMPVMTNSTITFDDFTFPYDFTILSNLYENASTPNTPAIELEENTWGMIAGDVTANGVLQYSGPGNDRGPIIAKIMANGGTDINSTINGGYWFEDVNMNNEIKYLGDNNDRGYILANLNSLTNPTYLNSIYTSLVPSAAGAKAATVNDNGPINIELNNGQLVLTTAELISNGMMDNIQFTLAWKSGDDEAGSAVASFASDCGLLPQGDVFEVNGESHQVFVSIKFTELPQEWVAGQSVKLMSFNKIPEGRVWIADNYFTKENNAMYYVSVWGKDLTGKIKTTNENTGSYQNLSVYPNPANKGTLNVEIPSEIGSQAHVKIFDMQGNLQYDKNQNAGSGLIQINISQLKSGVYMLMLIGENELHQARFVITR